MKRNLDSLIKGLESKEKTKEKKGKEQMKRRVMSDDEYLLLKVGYGLYYLLCSTNVYQNKDMDEKQIKAFRHESKLRYRRVVRELGKEMGVSANDIHNAYMNCGVTHMLKEAYIRIKHLGE